MVRPLVGKKVGYALDGGLIIGGGAIAGAALGTECEPEEPDPRAAPGVIVCGTNEAFVAANRYRPGGRPSEGDQNPPD